MTNFTTKEHWTYFAEFVRWETACGGPDPHLAYVGHLAYDQEWQERAWRIGCYLACYNVPTGIVLWTHWPWLEVNEPEPLERWLREHWEGLSWRRERRAVRSVPKLARHLTSLADWIGKLHREPWLGTGDYDAAWRSAEQIYGTGRYIKHKLLEGLGRYCDIGVRLGDIRARGAWSPRATLALLYPQHAVALISKGTGHDSTAEMCAAWAREELAERYGLRISWYDLQVMLCEYRESAISRRQYPGRSHDSELGHFHKIAHRWGDDVLAIPFHAAREACVPSVNRGELHGWEAAREELGDVLADHRYTWRDLEYDYTATRKLGGNFGRPVERVAVA